MANDKRQYKVFRNHSWGIGGAYSTVLYMDKDGSDVGPLEAAKFDSKEEAEAAAKKNGWQRRFRKRVCIE